ncbi:MAG: DUF2155 domain-containing protein [Roseovarius sp.]
MRRALAACLAAALAAPLAAPGVAQERTTRGQGAILRGLDRVNGHTQDLDLATGETTEFGSLRVRLDECRLPAENPDGDAYAFMTIHSTDTDARLFSGWMLASSPALNALEHQRYDVWVLRCKT